MILLDNISGNIAYLPILVMAGFVLKWRSKPAPDMVQFTLYLLIAAIIQFNVRYIVPGNNLWLFHFYTPVETFLLISLLGGYIKLKNPYVLALMFSVQAIILDLLFGDLGERDIYPGFVEYISLGIILLSAIKILPSDYRFFISAGVAVYAVPNAVTYFSFAKLDFIPLTIHSITNISMNILFITGIICYYKAEIPYIKLAKKFTQKTI